jgi:4'-phosphopantetheinyl transferase
LAFGYHPRGKPFLAQSALNSDLRFNLSHSGLIVAIALAHGREVGVDLEQIDRLADWSLLAERIFSSRELCELRALPASKQREAFFNGWTRKEAYLKATSEGLTDDLPAIEVTLVPGQKPRLLRLPAGPEAVRQWRLEKIPLSSEFAGAVAFQSAEAVQRFYNL